MGDAQEAAETLALRALGWLAENDEILMQFVSATGASADDLRQGAGDPRFLGSVLDFIMTEDAWVVSFCQGAGLPCDAPMRARGWLPGGATPHFT